MGALPQRYPLARRDAANDLTSGHVSLTVPIRGRKRA
jgi:hypothetical protein